MLTRYQFFAGAVLGTVVVGVDNGMGRHQDYQTGSELTTLVKASNPTPTSHIF